MGIPPGSQLYNYDSAGNAMLALAGNASNITVVDAANLYVATDLEALLLEIKTSASVRRVRGIVYNNVASLAAFTVTGNAYDDGLTYVAGDRVFLVAQSTAPQNGVYVVGTVASTTAPLTRATDMPAGLALSDGSVVAATAGTIFARTEWKATAVGGAVVGTTDPAFYPRTYKQTVTLSAGTYTIGFGSTATPDEPLWLLAGATVNCTSNTHAGTLGTNRIEAPSASRVTGINGTAVVVINSIVDAGTVAGSDTSTVDVLVTNW